MSDNSSFRFWDIENGEQLPVGVMFCIGRNYAAHAKEMGNIVPIEAPLVFLKPPSAYLPNANTVKIPKFSAELHHEVELVLVLGADAKNVRREDAADYIMGFGVGVDLTLRDIQAQAKQRGEPWAVSKGFRHSAPISSISPFSTMPKSGVDLKLSVNGEIRQQGHTSQMERNIGELLEYLSGVFELRRGDCIFSGTPSGVDRLQSGDRVTAEIPDLLSLNFVIE